MKALAGREVAKRVNDGVTIGVGTGSTVDAALDEIAGRVKDEGLTVKIIPSSYQTALNCSAAGLTVLSPLYEGEIDWGFDGADEVDEKFRLIKGRGGAMLQEKILASKCRKFIIIVDETKLVKRLGENHAVPVEVVPQAWSLAAKEIRKLGAQSVELRRAAAKHGPVVTEGGNLILDARFSEIPESLGNEINCIVGVVENGIFSGGVDEVIVAGKTGVRSLFPE